MRYSFYPGCSMTATGVEYAKSIAYVNGKISMELLEIPDTNCCGATAGHAKSEALGLALPARNLALCEAQGLGLPVAVACAACYSRMKTASCEARRGGERRARLEGLIEMPLSGENDVITLLEAYSQPDTVQAIQGAMIKSFQGLRVACYYGCLFSRPGDITGVQDPENPMDMDTLVSLTGAEPVQWDFKTECCGAAHHVDMPQSCKPLLYRIYRNARNYGAQAIVTGCPLCTMNLDMRQKDVNKVYGETFDLPVYYFTELLALAMGASEREIGLSKHFYPAQRRIAQTLTQQEEC